MADFRKIILESKICSGRVASKDNKRNIDGLFFNISYEGKTYNCKLYYNNTIISVQCDRDNVGSIYRNPELGETEYAGFHSDIIEKVWNGVLSS